MKGIGVDTVALKKFINVIEQSGEQFIKHVFTSKEQQYCSTAPNPFQSYAGHFAAKEAVVKAIPSLRSFGVDWQNIEVSHDNFGAPKFVLEGRLLENLKRIEGNAILLSISHTSETAVAMVVVS
jgi:holo-[acyl-carrier protein] synthase